MAGISLLIVSKREIFREGLAGLLALESFIAHVDTCSSELEVVEISNKQQPHVIIIDIKSSECIEAISRIHDRQPATNILVLTHFESRGDFIAALRAGAKAYISEDTRFGNLVKTIPLVAQGELVVSPSMALEVIAGLKSLEEHNNHNNSVTLSGTNLLSERETGILALVEQGYTDREIAVSLFISEHTVNVHLRNIRQKLHAHNRQHAVILARTKGILPTPTLR